MKFPRIFIDKIKSETVEILGVKDSFRLNDKIDGIYFYEKLAKKVISLYHIGSIFNTSFLDKSILVNSKSVIELNGKEICVVGVFLNEKIVIPNLKVDYFLVVGVFEDLSGSRILGQISYEDCLLKRVDNPLSNLIDYICILDRNEIEKYDKSKFIK
jgi:hypothetical protein